MHNRETATASPYSLSVGSRFFDSVCSSRSPLIFDTLCPFIFASPTCVFSSCYICLKLDISSAVFITANIYHKVKGSCVTWRQVHAAFLQHPSWLLVSVDDTGAPTNMLTCKCFSLHPNMLVQDLVTCGRFQWLTALHVVLLPSSVSAASVAPAALVVVGYWYFEYCCCPVVLVCSDPFW